MLFMHFKKVKYLKPRENNGTQKETPLGFHWSYCGRQEEPAFLISRLLLRMRRMYVASSRLDFH